MQRKTHKNFIKIERFLELCEPGSITIYRNGKTTDVRLLFLDILNNKIAIRNGSWIFELNLHTVF